MKPSWGLMAQLGHNMWDDYLLDPNEAAEAQSYEEEKDKPPRKGPKKTTRYRGYLQCDDACWRQVTDCAAKKKLNVLYIDCGEGIFYPSHPELAVTGTWSVDKTRAELARLRKLGFELVPKLNFSSCHDGWLKEYNRMISTPAYYQVVSDLIRDTCEIFDHPKLFHIGYDEEMTIAGFNNFCCSVRKGSLWWHDLNYTIDCVEKLGMRPVMWADAIWTGRDEYLRKMSRSVIQMNWYYRSDFSKKKQKWDYDFEKKGGWGECHNGVAAFLALEEGKFDQIPCPSDYTDDNATDALVRFCRDRIDPSRLLGFMMAPWASSTLPDYPGLARQTLKLKAIDKIAAARDKYYPTQHG